MTSGPGKGGPVPPGAPSGGPVTLAVVVKGYPRLSETFIAQEILALQERGVDLAIWSLRRPTDARRHVREEVPFYTGARVDVADLLDRLP